MQSQKLWHGSLLIVTLIAIAICVYLPIHLFQATPKRLSLSSGEPVVVQEAPIHTEVPDFTTYTDTRDKKQAFFAFLAPLVQAENSRIELQRDRLLRLYEQWQVSPKTLKSAELAWLKQLASLYRVKTDGVPLTTQFDLLLRRVDVVPEALVLVQAANESGWGTSRFARDGLNFFGQWCFSEGCGIVPDARPEGANHEVQKFTTVNASVRSYLRNINTHPAYLDLRVLREQRRLEGADIRALDLTPGLMRYSERGEEYIDELNSMIRVNRPLIVDVIQTESKNNEGSNSNSAPGSG